MSQNALVKKVVDAHTVQVSLMRQMECGLSCMGSGGCDHCGISLLHLGEGNALWAALVGLLVGFLPAWLYNRSLTRRKGPEFRVLRRLA